MPLALTDVLRFSVTSNQSVPVNFYLPKFMQTILRRWTKFYPPVLKAFTQLNFDGYLLNSSVISKIYSSWPPFSAWKAIIFYIVRISVKPTFKISFKSGICTTYLYILNPILMSYACKTSLVHTTIFILIKKL